jgi:hypothetical protein
VTPTLGIPSHTDVSLWYVIDVSKTPELRPDPGEYKGVRWFNIDEQPDWPGDVYDPHMYRFARKLTAALDHPPTARERRYASREDSAAPRQPGNW